MAGDLSADEMGPIATSQIAIFVAMYVVGMTIDQCDRLHLEAFVNVTTIMALGVEVLTVTMAIDEVGQGRHTIDMGDIEALALKDLIPMTKLTYRFLDGTSEMFPMCRSF